MSKLKEKVTEGGIVALVAIVIFFSIRSDKLDNHLWNFLSDYTVFRIRI